MVVRLSLAIAKRRPYGKVCLLSLHIPLAGWASMWSKMATVCMTWSPFLDLIEHVNFTGKVEISRSSEEKCFETPHRVNSGRCDKDRLISRRRKRSASIAREDGIQDSHDDRFELGSLVWDLLGPRHVCRIFEDHYHGSTTRFWQLQSTRF